MRLVLALLATALLGVGVTACGHASNGGGPVSYSSSTSPGGYLNDGDKERVGDSDGDNRADNDNDPSVDNLPSDYKPGENNSYHDTDDSGSLNYGRAASAVQERAVAAVVERYYAAAAAGDGAGACAQLRPGLAKAVPSDYGQLGPSYLRGGRTCAAVMILLFKHYNKQLAAPVAVTGVRVAGQLAYALLGSTVTPASYIIVQREGSTWKVAQLLGTQNSLI
jgi:hypothetical protein